MRPTISEFSFGYALTEELVHGAMGGLLGAPVFPSLYREGSLGYDVAIPFVGVPVFMQFKLSHYMTRSSAAEYALFGGTYYRFFVHASSKSRQHELLQKLQESEGNVYYAAPLFWMQEELNSFYGKRAVFDNTALFYPMDIRLPDDDEHYVAFSGGSPFFERCSSEPERITKPYCGGLFKRYLTASLASKISEINEDMLVRLCSRMINIADRARVDLKEFRSAVGKPKPTGRDRAYLAGRASYLARFVFDAQLFIFYPRPQE